MGSIRRFAITFGMTAISIFAQSRGAFAATSPLSYGGGRIISHPHIYITFWRNAGESNATADPNNVFGSMQTFLTGIGGWEGMDVTTQYSGGGKNMFNDAGVAGTWTDNTPVPSNPTEAQIAATAIRASQHFSAQNDPDAVQFILTTATRTYSLGGCAHHTFIANGSFPTVAYIDLPYSPRTCGVPGGVPGYFYLAVHELTEALTDPIFDGWGPPSTEIADKCAQNGIPIPPFAFVLPPLYSNASQSCVTSHPYYMLQFNDRSTERVSGVSWPLFPTFAATCGKNAVMVGISNLPSGQVPRSALCAKSTHANSSTGTILDISSSSVQPQPFFATDWDFGFYKGECANNQYVSGVGQNQISHTLNQVRCSPGVSVNSCTAITLAAADQRRASRNGDWSIGAFKNECGQHEVVKGVSVSTTTGIIHKILCCNGNY
jgi:hypothetical protein